MIETPLKGENMSGSILPYSWDYSDWKEKTVTSLLAAPTSKQAETSLLEIAAQSVDLKVDISLKQVSGQVTQDLAEVTAGYLVQHPELVEEYVIVILEPEDGGREARAFRRSDVTAELSEPEKTAVLEDLDSNPLLYRTDPDQVPETPQDDPELLGLAAVIQNFLDERKEVLDLLDQAGFSPFSAA